MPVCSQATLVMGAALFLLPPREWGSFRIISFVIIAAVCAFVSALLVTALWGVMNERGSAVSMLPLHRHAPLCQPPFCCALDPARATHP